MSFYVVEIKGRKGDVILVPGTFEAFWQMNDGCKLQLPQSFGTFQFRRSFFRALHLPTPRSLCYPVLEKAKAEPARISIRFYGYVVTFLTISGQ